MTEAAPPAVSIASRLLNGLVLPLLLFLLWQWALMASTSGTGSWAGMGLFFFSLLAVPALPVLNLWVLAVPWRGHFRAFFGGLALPALIGAAEFLLLHGRDWQKKLIGAAISGPYAPLTLIALCTPLIAVLVYWAMRARARRGCR